MLDIAAFLAVVLLLPLVLAVISALVIVALWSLVSRRRFPWARVAAAMLAAMRLELAFLVVGGFLLAVLFGGAVGYGFPVLVGLATVLVGVCGFLYFLVAGVPRWCEWSTWRERIWPSVQA
jgi:hypothetical protein